MSDVKIWLVSENFYLDEKWVNIFVAHYDLIDNLWILLEKQETEKPPQSMDSS